MATIILPISEEKLLGYEGSRMPIFGLVQTFPPRSLWSIYPSITSPSSNLRWSLLDFKYQIIKMNALPDSQ